MLQAVQILREPLGSVALSLLSLGIRSIHSFPFLSRPSNKAISDAVAYLQSLGAVDKGLALTEMGRSMSRYPIEPRLARLLCTHGAEDVFPELVAVASSVALSFEVRKNQCNAGYLEGSKSDFLVQLSIYSDFLKSSDKRGFCLRMGLSYSTAVEKTKMASHLMKIAGSGARCAALDLSSAKSTRIRRIVYCGFVDHLAVPSSGSHFFRAEEVFPSSSGISVDASDFVVFESLVSAKKLYMRNITVVDREWF